MEHTASSAHFLVQTLFGFYALALFFRLLLRLTAVDSLNPVAGFVLRITEPALRPLRPLLRPWRRLDLAALLLLLILKYIEIALLGVLSGQAVYPLAAMTLAVAESATLAASTLFWSILIQVLLSWLRPELYLQHPLPALLYQVNEPLLQRVRRWLPPVGGVDLAPLVAALGLRVVEMALTAPLRDLAAALAG